MYEENTKIKRHDSLFENVKGDVYRFPRRAWRYVAGNESPFRMKIDYFDGNLDRRSTTRTIIERNNVMMR